MCFFSIMQISQRKRERKSCRPVHAIVTGTFHPPLRKTSGRWDSRQHRPVWREVQPELENNPYQIITYVTSCKSLLWSCVKLDDALLKNFCLATSTGYIKEDEQPDVRMRRRRPYLAKFSPKAKSQNKQSWVDTLWAQHHFRWIQIEIRDVSARNKSQMYVLNVCMSVFTWVFTFYDLNY